MKKKEKCNLMKAGWNMQTHSVHRCFMFPAYWSVTKRPYKLHKRLRLWTFPKTRNFQRVSWISSGFPNSKILRASVMWYITCSELALWTYFKARKAWPFLSIMLKIFHFIKNMCCQKTSNAILRSNTNASLK